MALFQAQSPFKGFSQSQSPIPRFFRRVRSSRALRSAPEKISTLLSPSCVTIFTVAVHPEESQVSQGALAARKTWLDLFPDNDLRPHSAGPYGNFFALTWPLSKTDRVQLATEIIETLWLYDGKHTHLPFIYLSHYDTLLTVRLDLIEDIPHDEAVQTHEGLRDAFRADSPTSKPSRKTIIADAFKTFASRMSKLDPKGTPRVIESLKSYLVNYDSHKAGELPSIKEYTEYRILNVGFW